MIVLLAGLIVALLLGIMYDRGWCACAMTYEHRYREELTAAREREARDRISVLGAGKVGW